MQFEITWTITAIIAVSSFLSPILVAIINNRHHTRIRKLELEYDKNMKQLDLNNQATIRQADIYYADKKQVFTEFINASCNLYIHSNGRESYDHFIASLNRAILFCNSQNQEKLKNFLSFINNEIYCKDIFNNPTCVERLFDLSLSLNHELELTKPVIDCKSRER